MKNKNEDNKQLITAEDIATLKEAKKVLKRLAKIDLKMQDEADEAEDDEMSALDEKHFAFVNKLERLGVSVGDPGELKLEVRV